MKTINLDRAWDYITPRRTIAYPAGQHEVADTIAERAEADGVIPKEEASGNGKQPATPRAKSAAQQG